MKDTMADFLLSEDQKEIRELARQFSNEKVAPVAIELDQKHEYPIDLIHQMGDLGMLGACIPEEYGGSNLGVLSHAVIMEEVSRNSGTLGFVVDAHCSLGLMPMLFGGTEEQKQTYLVPGAQGKELFAFALTEPHSGSDAGGTKTTAIQDGDSFVINGAKSWITNVGYAKTYMVCCKTDPAAPGSKGISLIMVRDGTPGLVLGKPEQKLCIRGSQTAQLFFDDCRVPRENLVGKLDGGLPLFMQGLDEGRIAIGAVSVGMAQGVLERAVKYAKERHTFGKPITSYQAVSFMLAEMETAICIGRSMLYSVAKMKDAGLPFRKEAAMLKNYTCEMVNKVCYQGIQILGGNGVSEEYEVERFYRDARLCTIGEGTTEINSMLISRFVLDKY